MQNCDRSRMSSIEYVPRSETISDIALQDTENGSLRTTTSVLLSILVMLSFLLNLLLLSAILSSAKLRNVVLNALFCNLAALNIVDTVAGMFMSLLFVANGKWPFSDALCHFNAALQQFVHMDLLMGIMIMAIERAITLFFPQLRTFTFARTLYILAALFTMSICFAIPVLTSNIPVKPFRFRYVCAVNSEVPILYPIMQILVYGGCLFVSLICFGALLSRGNHDKSRSLPIQSQDYSSFIKKSRALQDHHTQTKLVLFLMITFILIQGPDIILTFYVEVRNSREILQYSDPFEVPQDAATILNWLRFIYPIIAPLLIYSVCSDIWLKLQQLMCFRHYLKTTGIGRCSSEQCNGGGAMDQSNVMTLVATPQGLHLRLPPTHADEQQQISNDLFSNNNRLQSQYYGVHEQQQLYLNADRLPMKIADDCSRLSQHHQRSNAIKPSKIPRLKRFAHGSKKNSD
ncbi:unnamed protein product [Anisakis simplex]|uniref:G_PROTEIN_RECEP_F1_2 domain-containing protein n=1 Tax=Anisakis simplex TaxID=6269 RepID=A0A0M3JVS2_ANISI|nr:unnamed protein product [Anisakis simplex]